MEENPDPRRRLSPEALIWIIIPIAAIIVLLFCGGTLAALLQSPIWKWS